MRDTLIGTEHSDYLTDTEYRMNYFPSLMIQALVRLDAAIRVKAGLALCMILCAACSAPAAETKSPESSDPLRYDVHYIVKADPVSGVIDVTMSLRQPKSLLREITMIADTDRQSGFAGDGSVSVDGTEVRWIPPATGGSLRWRVRVLHLRGNSGYDAWLGTEWGLFRAEDIIPRASTRTLKGAYSATEMEFRLPRKWTVVTQYFGQSGHYSVNNAGRRFDQPSGWIITGEIGVRRDTIAGVRVAVAGPLDSSIRRLDTLAILNWTLPELARILPEMPTRLTVFSAGSPMWRGGLSAPRSLYVHADRPLISENATSTLLHEVMHISLGIAARHGYDWIVEGLAEHYSLELLGRSGTISASRYKQAREQQAKWAEDARTLCAPSSTGATTALAVTVLGKLDQEMRAATNGASDLDDVVRELTKIEAPVDLGVLQKIVAGLTSAKIDTLLIDNLPGCSKILSIASRT